MQLLMEAMVQMASVARTADLYAFEDIVGASEDERQALYARVSRGQARALRMLIAGEQPKAQMPKLAKLQSPGVRSGGTASGRPILNVRHAEDAVS